MQKGPDNPLRIVLLVYLYTGVLAGGLVACIVPQALWARWAGVATFVIAALVPILAHRRPEIRIINEAGRTLHTHETGVVLDSTSDDSLSRQMVVFGGVLALVAFGFGANLIAGWRVALASTFVVGVALLVLRRWLASRA
jgi:hypothetical protein